MSWSEDVIDDCWGYIFTFLPYEFRRDTVSAVCVQFSELWKQQLDCFILSNRQQFPLLDDPDLLENVTSRLRELTIVGSSLGSEFSDERLVQVLDLVREKQVKSLSLKHCNYVYANMLSQKVTDFVPSIESLDFSSCLSMQMDAFANYIHLFPNLTTLKLAECSNLTDRFLKTVEPLLASRITVLEFGFSKISPAALGPLFTKWTKLKHLSLGTLEINERTFKYFNVYETASLENLRYFNIKNGREDLTEKIAFCISHFPSVATLDLSNTDVYISAFSELCQMRDQPCLARTLRSLVLNHVNSRLTNRLGDPIAKNFVLLQQLHLRRVEATDNTTIASLASSKALQESLQVLDISDTSVSGAGIATIFRSFHNLKSLEMDNLYLRANVDHSLLSQLFSRDNPEVHNFPQLTKVSFECWNVLDDDLFDTLFNENQPMIRTLETLNISACRHITDKSLEQVVSKRLVQLHRLIMTAMDNTHITEQGMCSLCSLVSDEAQMRVKAEKPNIFVDIRTLEVVSDARFHFATPNLSFIIPS